MKRYPEYKENDCGFLSVLPAHWQMKRLKHVTESINNGTTAPQIRSGQTNYTVTRIETISTGEVNFQKVGHVNYWDGIENFRLILGDILFSHINSLEILGNCAMFQNTSRLYHGMNLLKIRPNDLIAHRFLLYWLRSYSTNQLIKSFAKVAIGQVSVSITTLKEIPVAFPPLPEQHAIASFLNRKTEQIDELILAKQRKIELLGEYRASVIHQTVTKGLVPNVEMKPSGVEWIGVIPRHWKAKKLRHVSAIFKGGTPKRNVDRYFQGDLPWARPVDITALKGALYIGDTEIHISEEALGNSGARRLPAGTVLLTSRATIGETAITTVPMATNQGFANFVCNAELRNIFLAYYLRAIKELLISLGSGSTFLEVTKKTLLGIGIALPPLAEQAQIINYLDHKTKQIDELRSNEEQTIKLLREYRQSLISEVVTGKIDVRGEV